MLHSKSMHHFFGCINDFYLLCYGSQNATHPPLYWFKLYSLVKFR